jgi:hypothetical protein
MCQYSTHLTDHVIRLLTDARVRVIAFAPQITQIFQVLDVTLFSVLETCPKYELPFENHNPTVRFIIKAYHDFKQTIMPRNVLGALHSHEADFDTMSEPYRLLFDDEKLRGSTGFQEACSLDFLLDQLSSRHVLIDLVGSTSLTKVT